MNGKQIKHFRKQCERLAPANYIRAIKLFKKIKRTTWLRHNIPNVYKHAATKRHSSESFLDFKKRRKVCNERRRLRELALKHAKKYYKTVIKFEVNYETGKL